MLFRIVAVLILVIVATCAVDIILVQRRRSAEGTDVKSLTKRRRRSLFAKILFWASTSVFLIHITGYFTPVETLVALAFSLIIPCAAILLSSLLLTEKNDPK